MQKITVKLPVEIITEKIPHRADSIFYAGKILHEFRSEIGNMFSPPRVCINFGTKTELGKDVMVMKIQPS